MTNLTRLLEENSELQNEVKRLLKRWQQLKTDLPKIQHTIWSHWMKYMFTQGNYDNEGNWIMPKEKVIHWQQQMNTEYIDLSKKEKQSDIDIVKRFIFKELEQ